MKASSSSTKSSASKSTTQSIKIGLTKEQRTDSIDTLKAILANQHVLYIKTRNFHWNLVGPRFHSLHEFFESQYKALEAAIDQTAERIRMIGGVSPGSMKSFLEDASLKECASSPIDGLDAVRALRADHETVIRELREAIDKLSDIGDAGTEDFVTGLIQEHEQAAWMLRSYEG